MNSTGRLYLVYYPLLIIALLFQSACAELPAAYEAQPLSSEAGLEEIIPLDPELTFGTLDNGLTYYIHRNLKPENRAELRLVINAGSVLEDDDQQGLAHFVEHMAFNGTKNFKKQEIVDFLESIGMRYGPELNAYTGFDQTVYLLQVPTEDRAVLEKALQILEDWAHNISFDEEELAKERRVIIEEWRLGRGAEARMRDKQFPILFKDSRYAERSPIGKLEIIEQADVKRLKRFYRDWYRPDLMAVIAVGDFEPDWMEELIHSKFSRLRVRERPPERRIYPVPSHQETLFAPATDPEATDTRVNIYIKHEVSPFHTVGDYRQRLVEYIYNGILSDRLWELTRQAEPPFISGYAGNYRAIRSRELYVLGARVEDNRILKGLEALLTEIERARRYGFTETELERQKEQILTWIENAYNERENTESESRVEEYVRHFLEGDPTPGIEYEYELFKRYLPGISLEEVNQLSHHWLTPENRVILVNAPQKPQTAIPAEREILSLFEEVRRKSIDPYEDTVPDRPLIARAPEEGKISAEKKIAELNLTEWRLSNGVQVVLKPTDFKSEQVLLAAFSPGGHSLVPDEDYIAAVTAAAVITEGGVGEFTQIELEKKLAGIGVEVSPWIGRLHEGIQGSAETEDLETMFQLIHLYFTSPRRDENTFAAYKTRRAAGLQNRLASPEAVFWDTVQTVITQDHYRMLPWNPETLEEMDLEVSYSFYQDRFMDAGDFTFFLVGNFDADQIGVLVRRYLGSLPTGGRIETWRDLGIDPPRGIIRRTVKKGLEPKGRVQIIFSGLISWSLENRLKLQALADVLDIRLRESLREDAGGTYSVGVVSSVSHYPDEEYHVYIGFGCDPEEAEELSALVFEQIKLLRTEGPKEEELNKVKEIFKRERETALKTNEFWVQTLQYYYAHKQDPLKILEYESSVDALDAEAIRQTAHRYLDLENYVRVVLYPENWQ